MHLLERRNSHLTRKLRYYVARHILLPRTRVSKLVVFRAVLTSLSRSLKVRKERKSSRLATTRSTTRHLHLEELPGLPTTINRYRKTSLRSEDIQEVRHLHVDP
ncbi:Oidioi.mRNA.OKI2018_I69.XSR.g14207.t1.cds [Oikopleura dioica]|uniref:Oidioi.mRNA.OKI2018_I69.XSR.g14207.t1.cds n=1 Tax=Oikopleura dioica TaxID=34765 RepID=A0ABN7S934_OIKDI|nr:Oidioi.mRNA.OKI2018_I69.XSR.g14207.t1.cds [Oikopleura dioica]